MKKIIGVILALLAGIAQANLVDLRIYQSSTTLQSWPATVQDMSAVGALKGDEVIVDNILNLQCANQSWVEMCKDRLTLNRRLKERNPKLQADRLSKEAFRLVGQEGINLPMPAGFVMVAFAQAPAQLIQQPATSVAVPAASAPIAPEAVSPEVAQALKALSTQGADARAKALEALETARRAASDGRDARTLASDAKTLSGNANTAAVTASARAASANQFALGGAELARQAKSQAATAVEATEQIRGEVEKVTGLKPLVWILFAAVALIALGLAALALSSLKQSRDLKSLEDMPQRVTDSVAESQRTHKAAVTMQLEKFEAEVEGSLAALHQSAEQRGNRTADLEMAVGGFQRTVAVLGARVDGHERQLKSSVGWVILPFNFESEVEGMNGQPYHPIVQVTGDDDLPQRFRVEITPHPEKGEEWLLIQGIDRLTEVKAENLQTALLRAGGFGGGKNRYRNLEVPDQAVVHCSNGFIAIEPTVSEVGAVEAPAAVSGAGSIHASDSPVATTPSGDDKVAAKTVVSEAPIPDASGRVEPALYSVRDVAPDATAEVEFAQRNGGKTAALPSKNALARLAVRRTTKS